MAEARQWHTDAPSSLLAASMKCKVVLSLLQVGRWVAIGCPFGGAPGYAVDGLITGVQFGGSLGDFFFVQQGTFRQASGRAPCLSASHIPAGCLNLVTACHG